MISTTQRKILDALLLVMRPLARVLLRSAIGYREFSEIAKSAFVEVATEDYGLRGRPTNISRVAVMTGLTRKEVRRIRDKVDSGDAGAIFKYGPHSELLHRWYSDQDFLAENGNPKVLPFDVGAISFTELVRRYGGDIPPGAMRTELKRVGSIEELKDGSLAPVRRDVTPPGIDEKLIHGLVGGLYPLALNVAHNTDPRNEGNTWTQKRAMTKYVRDDDIVRFRRISKDRLNEFITSIDDLFSAYETLYKDDVEAESPRAVGVTVFYFEDNAGDSAISE